MYCAPRVTFEGKVRYPPKKEYFHAISSSLEFEMTSPMYIYPRYLVRVFLVFESLLKRWVKSMNSSKRMKLAITMQTSFKL